MYDYPEVQVKLFELMREKNIRTIKEMSEKTGLSRKAISQAMNNRNHRMHTDTVARICVALECEIGDLLVLKR